MVCCVDCKRLRAKPRGGGYCQSLKATFNTDIVYQDIPCSFYQPKTVTGIPGNYRGGVGVEKTR